MYVEIIGVSGSGKTTTAKEIMNAVRARGIKARNLHVYCSRAQLLNRYHWRKNLPDSERALHQYTLGTWAASVAYPELVENLFAATADKPTQRLGCARALAALSMLSEIGHDNLVITEDEGLLYRGAVAHTLSDDEGAFERFLTLAPFPDALVFLNVEPEEALRRAQERGKLLRLPEGVSHKDFFEHQNAKLERIAGCARSGGKLVIEGNSYETLADIVGDASEKIRLLMKPGRK